MCLRPSVPEKLNECQKADTTGGKAAEADAVLVHVSDGDEPLLAVAAAAATEVADPMLAPRGDKEPEEEVEEEASVLRGTATKSPPKQLAI